jgi:hypothetical protein
VEHLANEHTGNLRPDGLQFDEILDLLRVAVRRLSLHRHNRIALCFNCLDQFQYQLGTLQLARDLRLEARWQGASISGTESLERLHRIRPHGFVVIDAVQRSGAHAPGAAGGHLLRRQLARARRSTPSARRADAPSVIAAFARHRRHPSCFDAHADRPGRSPEYVALIILLQTDHRRERRLVFCQCITAHNNRF